MALIIIFVAVLAGVTYLQIWLSRRDNPWAGLVLPAISVLFSALIIMGRVLYPSSWYGIAISLVVLIFCLPPAMWFLIYFVCRWGRNRNRDLEKMSIQDID